jgi:hypothetical protein
MKLFYSTLICLFVSTLNAQVGLHFDDADDMSSATAGQVMLLDLLGKMIFL